MSMGKTQNIVSQIKNKYIGMSVPVKAAFWFTVCNFYQRGISMITTPIFTRMLSTDEYGYIVRICLGKLYWQWLSL